MNDLWTLIERIALLGSELDHDPRGREIVGHANSIMKLLGEPQDEKPNG